MPFTVFGIGTNANTSGTTLTLTTTADCPPGSLLIVVAGETSTITQIGTISAIGGVTPSLLESSALNNVNANGWGGIFAGYNPVDIGTGSTITYNKQGTTGATISAFYIQAAVGNALQGAPSFGSSTNPSNTLGVPAGINQIIIQAAVASGGAATWAQGTGVTGTPNGAVPVGTISPGIEVAYTTGNATAFNYAPTLSLSRAWAAFQFTVGQLTSTYILRGSPMGIVQM